MELRQLEAFVAVASELHFGRAAERLHIGTPTLSELVRRLERELGTALLTRTTRRVALTPAGSELLVRSKVILEEAAAAKAAVRRLAEGEAGRVRLGITPPAGPTLAPLLVELFTAEVPHAEVRLQRMWLPHLTDALADGDIDVALTCGTLPEHPRLATEVFAAEELLVGLRRSHRLAGGASVALGDLGADVLGAPAPGLFPAWAVSVHQALDTAGIAPPSVELATTDLGGRGWTLHEGVDWILLIASLVANFADAEMVVLPVRPVQLVPFSLQWSPELAPSAAVARFVRLALRAELPPGWYPGPDHIRHGVTPTSAPDRSP